MMGISLFGTCTMKYNPRVNEQRRGASVPRRAAPGPGRGDAAGRAGDRPRVRPDRCASCPAWTAFVFQPGGGADAAYTHACITRAYHAARGELGSATRSSPRSRRTRATRDGRGGRLRASSRCRSRRTATRRSTRCEAAVSRPHRRADGQQPRRHGHLQPAHQAVGRDRPRGRRPGLLRPRQLQRRDGPASARASSASTPACSCCTRRSARRRAAAARRSAPTAAARSWSPFLPRPLVAPRRRRLPARARRAATSIGRVREFWGNVPAGRQGLLVGARDGRRRASATPPTSRCWPTTTWRRGCCRSAASRSRTRT